MAKSLFEELGGKYERQGDCLIPYLTVPIEEEQPIGTWGQRHLDYLKQYHKVTYINLLTSGRLNAYLAEIDKRAQERFERLIQGVKQAQANGTPKRRKRLRMDRAAQQHKGLCEGDCERGNYFCIRQGRQREILSLLFMLR